MPQWLTNLLAPSDAMDARARAAYQQATGQDIAAPAAAPAPTDPALAQTHYAKDILQQQEAERAAKLLALPPELKAQMGIQGLTSPEQAMQWLRANQLR